MDSIKYNIENKIFAYNVIRMGEEEEKESFWYHWGRLVKAIRLYHEEKEEDKPKKISTLCIFIHSIV